MIMCFSSFCVKSQTLSVRVTHYHPTKEECDSDPLVTADGSVINLHKLKNGSIKWCAVSRDLWNIFPKNRPKRIRVHGVGVYEVRDKTGPKARRTVDILTHPNDKKKIHIEKCKITIIK